MEDKQAMIRFNRNDDEYFGKTLRPLRPSFQDQVISAMRKLELKPSQLFTHNAQVLLEQWWSMSPNNAQAFDFFCYVTPQLILSRLNTPIVDNGDKMASDFANTYNKYILRYIRSAGKRTYVTKLLEAILFIFYVNTKAKIATVGATALLIKGSADLRANEKKKQQQNAALKYINFEKPV